MTNPVPARVPPFVVETTDALTARLGEYGISLPDEGALAAVNAWLADETEQGETIEDVLARSEPEEVAAEMASYMLSQIAEERPGTDPFSHEPTIPMPLPIATRLVNSMAVAADIALLNDDVDRARGFIAACCSVSGLLTAALIDGDVIDSEITLDSGNGSTLTFPGPLVLLPQPGLAYCARMLGAVAECLEDGGYDTETITDPDDAERLIHALLSDASGIRRFTAEYGVDPNPTPGS